jgi:hypothetical protein
MIAERERVEWWALMIAGLACALTSSTAFWAHMLGLVPMPFFINFVGRPSIVLFLILGLFSWQRNLSFWKRLRAGLTAGVTALLAYDLTRLALYSAILHDFYPFQSHRIFGYLMTGQSPDTDAAFYAGWLFHFWNGFSFAVIYVLIAGPARWYWGWVWAMILEVAMLLTYPTFLSIKMSVPFVLVSLIGHTAYGVALGLTASYLMRDVE